MTGLMRDGRGDAEAPRFHLGRPTSVKTEGGKSPPPVFSGKEYLDRLYKGEKRRKKLGELLRGTRLTRNSLDAAVFVHVSSPLDASILAHAHADTRESERCPRAPAAQSRLPLPHSLTSLPSVSSLFPFSRKTSGGFCGPSSSKLPFLSAPSAWLFPLFSSPALGGRGVSLLSSLLYEPSSEQTSRISSRIVSSERCEAAEFLGLFSYLFSFFSCSVSTLSVLGEDCRVSVSFQDFLLGKKTETDSREKEERERRGRRRTSLRETEAMARLLREYLQQEELQRERALLLKEGRKNGPEKSRVWSANRGGAGGPAASAFLSSSYLHQTREEAEENTEESREKPMCSDQHDVSGGICKDGDEARELSLYKRKLLSIDKQTSCVCSPSSLVNATSKKVGERRASSLLGRRTGKLLSEEEEGQGEEDLGEVFFAGVRVGDEGRQSAKEGERIKVLQSRGSLLSTREGEREEEMHGGNKKKRKIRRDENEERADAGFQLHDGESKAKLRVRTGEARTSGHPPPSSPPLSIRRAPDTEGKDSSSLEDRSTRFGEKQRRNSSPSHAHDFPETTECPSPEHEREINRKHGESIHAPSSSSAVCGKEIDSEMKGRKNFSHRSDSSPSAASLLPILQYEASIEDAVYIHPVTIIVGETGSGKSTQIPQILLKSSRFANSLRESRHAQSNTSPPSSSSSLLISSSSSSSSLNNDSRGPAPAPSLPSSSSSSAPSSSSSASRQPPPGSLPSSSMLMRIGITQPRRVAAISLARRVSSELQQTVGSTVGYSVRFEEMSSPGTRIMYLTDGMLIREAIRDSCLSRYAVLVLDESHERSTRTDVLMGLLKRLLQKRQDFFRVIIMSATLDVKKFENFFFPFPTKSLFIPGRLYPIELFYLTQPEEDYVDVRHPPRSSPHTPTALLSFLAYSTYTYTRMYICLRICICQYAHMLAYVDILACVDACVYMSIWESRGCLSP